MIANNFPWPEHPFDGMFNLRQIHALTELGHTVEVVRCVPWAPPMQKKWQRYRSVPSRYAVEGISVRTLRGLMGPKSWGIGTLRQQLGAQMAAIVREVKPDIVHVQGLLHSGVLAIDLDVPYVVTAHGIEAHTLPWARQGLERTARLVLKTAACAVGVSEFIAGYLRALGRADARVIFNGADERLFHPSDRSAARTRLGIALDRPVIGFVGHIEKHKGILDLEAALMQLRDLRPHLLFAGTGSLREGLEARLRAAGISATFLGAVDQHQLGDVYAAIDLLTLPSYCEGLPTVICEAMNCARAVVATRLAGIPEIVRNDVNGFCVEPGDVDALAKHLRVVLTNPEMRERFETNAYAFAKDHLTWRHNAKQYDTLYHQYARTERIEAGAFVHA